MCIMEWRRLPDLLGARGTFSFFRVLRMFGAHSCSFFSSHDTYIFATYLGGETQTF